MQHQIQTVDAYLDTFPEGTKIILDQIREIIRRTSPNALESIAYGMPAYKTHNKPLVYFAGYKNHIGFYATPTGHDEFKDELVQYKQGKGSVQFPLNRPIPFELISRIVEFRVQENKNKYGKK